MTKFIKYNKPVSYSTGDLRIIENYPGSKIQLFFPVKPGREIRIELNANNFRLSRKRKCYECWMNKGNFNRLQKLLRQITNQK